MILQIGDILNELLGIFGIGILAGMVLVMFILYVLSIKWGIKKVDGTNNDFGSAFITALLSYVCSAIPCGCFLSAYIISTRHEVTYGKGILALILAALLPLIIGLIITVVFLVLTGGMAALLSIFGL
ncbi:MAG: hypothetical protein ACTSRX_02900 [Promethearchaeota archaeon]